MGSSPSKPSMTFDKYIENEKNKRWPSEVCPPERIELIKAQNLIKIKEIIQNKSKALNEFLVDIVDLLLVDNEKQDVPKITTQDAKKHVNLTDTDVVTVWPQIPKTYKNGFDFIFNFNELLQIFKSIIEKPFIVTIHSSGVYKIIYVHNHID
jgi:hypothetical protein